MKTSTWLLLAVVLMAYGFRSSQQKSRGTNYSQVAEQARAENKPILLDFTGSDWCGWCRRFKKEVLDTPEFAAYAQENLILMTVDFPRDTSLAPEVKAQNEQLKARYNAEGFPTLVLVDKNGRELGRQVGYQPGGPEPFITKLSTFSAAAADASTGGDKDFGVVYKAAATPPRPQPGKPHSRNPARP